MAEIKAKPIPCQFCGGDISPGGKHRPWCPVINPVGKKDG